jgi:hypothetical protein
MPVIRTSLRAFGVACAVFAVFHGIMSLLQLAEFMTRNGALPTPDQALVMYLRRIVIDSALLFAGHWLLRRAAIATRLAYGTMGGVAAAAGYAIALRNGLMFVAPPAGSHLTAGILPSLAGIIAGTLYLQFAGREVIALSAAQSPRGAVATDATAPTLFDGPVQVRTSLVAMLIASVIPACILFLFSSLFMIDGVASKPNWILNIAAGGNPSYVPVIALVATLLPAAFVVATAHAIARARSTTSSLDYTLAGTAAGALASLALTLFMPAALVLPFGLVSGALMGAAYRRFADLEPLALPEAILATDPATLVGADHPTRRGHAVITNP